MKLTGVLVVGSDVNKELLDSLFEAGLTPLVLADMTDAMNRLHRAGLAAVILDRDHTDIDALEFVLNVRDIEGRIPVFLTGGSAREARENLLLEQPGIFVIDRDRSPDALAEAVDQVVKGRENASQISSVRSRRPS